MRLSRRRPATPWRSGGCSTTPTSATCSPTIRVPTLVLSRGGEMEAEAHGVRGADPRRTAGDDAGHRGDVMQEHPDAYMDAVERFAHELREEEAELESVLATVLFTDIVGSTARQAELGDRRWPDLLQTTTRSCAAASRATAAASSTPPATASSPRSTAPRGIRCARAIVEGGRPLGLEVRAGLHTGDAARSTGKVGGLAVSIGARVTSLAGPSEILVSQTVRDLVAGSGLELADRGEHELKGVPGSWRVYAVA